MLLVGDQSREEENVVVVVGWTFEDLEGRMGVFWLAWSWIERGICVKVAWEGL